MGRNGRAAHPANCQSITVMPEHCPLPAGSTVWAYLRHSPGEDQSIDDQAAAVEEYCRQHGLILVQAFKDEFLSASDVARRSAFQRMLDLAQQDPPPVDGIVFWSWSRFAREETDAHFHKADLRRRGYILISITDEIPAGDFQYVFEALYHWRDAQYLKQISRDARRGQQHLAKQGFVPGGNPPVGYKVIQQKIGTKKNGQPRYGRLWVPDPDLEEAVRLAWEMRAAGHSYQEIHNATQLYKSKSCYKSMFTNSTYKGLVVYGGTEIQVPAIVDEETWEKVQEIMRSRKTGKSQKGKKWKGEHPRRHNSRFLLSGILFCGRCGSAMVGDQVRRWTHYICGQKKRRWGDCETPRISTRKIEGLIIEKTRAEILQAQNLPALLENINAQLSINQQHAQIELESINRKISELDTLIGRLLDAIEKRGLDDIISERLNEREAEREQLLRERRRLLAQHAGHLPQLTPNALQKILAQFEAALYEAGPADRRRAIQTLIERIDFDGETIKIRYTIPLSSDIADAPKGSPSISLDPILVPMPQST
ncbi:MAG: recombinase family protein [Chloroflexi bacterium]|nr:MAG: recombinase family protein [Chloroflexota bacterium]